MKESIPPNPYADYVTISYDDVLHYAALKLEEDPAFPDKRGKQFDYLRTMKAIREVLNKYKKELAWLGLLDRQIAQDAHEVLRLFEK